MYQNVADRFIGYKEVIAKATSFGAKKNVNFVEGRKLNFNTRPEHDRKPAMNAENIDLSEQGSTFKIYKDVTERQKVYLSFLDKKDAKSKDAIKQIMQKRKSKLSKRGKEKESYMPSSYQNTHG